MKYTIILPFLIAAVVSCGQENKNSQNKKETTTLKKKTMNTETAHSDQAAFGAPRLYFKIWKVWKL